MMSTLKPRSLIVLAPKICLSILVIDESFAKYSEIIMGTNPIIVEILTKLNQNFCLLVNSQLSKSVVSYFMHFITFSESKERKFIANVKSIEMINDLDGSKYANTFIMAKRLDSIKPHVILNFERECQILCVNEKASHF